MKNSTIQLTKYIWYWDLFCGSCDCQCQLLTNNRRPPPPSTTTCCSIHVLRLTFYVPIRKDSLKYIIENCDPQKKPPATQKNWLPLLNSCPLSEHCLHSSLCNTIVKCNFANLPSVGIRNIKNEEISLSNTAQYLSFTWLSSLSKVKYIQNTKYVKHKTLITENTAIVR